VELKRRSWRALKLESRGANANNEKIAVQHGRSAKKRAQMRKQTRPATSAAQRARHDQSFAKTDLKNAPRRAQQCHAKNPMQMKPPAKTLWPPGINPSSPLSRLSALAI